ncbi:MAG: Asp23/Gls24 family envelope stress response protein [Clostridium sp.]|nr:Asp23/Gls24 family envelope stress response protein [Clostridium sp.]MCM1170506.1 Asp23/Gls24 family envelope stress response protein [Clostridium sp.]MCM1208073.1 Asp23/Gls24 family envelope stress response protein [Ruminococcus sp.]
MGEIKDGVIEETENKIGKVSIADDVVASIAGIAAIEVKGVSKLTGNISKELVAKLGKKNLAKGVKVDIIEGTVDVDLSLELEYGNSIKTVSENVQIKVKQAIESMTGLAVGSVNVVVSGIKLEKE